MILGEPTLAVVSGTALSRDATKVVFGGPGKTYSLPNTIITIRLNAFSTFRNKQGPVSVRLNEGLEVLDGGSFFCSDIRRLVLPAGVRSVGQMAFYNCGRLESVDLRAARNLKELGESAFGQCKKLRQILLNEGLEMIGLWCFSKSTLEEVVLPGSVKHVGDYAFDQNVCLERVRFLGPSESEGQCAAHSDCEHPPR